MSATAAILVTVYLLGWFASTVCGALYSRDQAPTDPDATGAGFVLGAIWPLVLPPLLFIFAASAVAKAVQR